MARSALEYGRWACDEIMRSYSVNELPPQKYRHATCNYQQGVLLTGMAQLYCLTGEQRYLAYIGQWANAIQDEQGRITEYNEWISTQSLDFRQGGNVLMFLYRQLGDEHCLELARYLVETLDDYPRNSAGGFWHMRSTPDQMWLDGLYMVGPLMSAYARLTGQSRYGDDAAGQLLLMYEHMRDPATGLLRHGWDPTAKAQWADKGTGLSAEVWGRACGWYAAAVADMLDAMPGDHPDRQRIVTLQQELIAAILRYQSDEGRWYQVVDKWRMPDNWPENSCTSLVVYAICKGVRNGYLAPQMLAHARRADQR
ncbi:MAG: glycoside hydrolase family 105 protein, partial [Aristaeellaceae bacterium]